MALRVLVVDDSAYHRRTLARIVESDPSLTLVGTATDGEDAIKKVVNLKPDIVTCDLEMPRMDGYTFLRWLMRTFPRPVLVVSSRESNKSVFKALELGAADFVVKPVNYASVRLEEIENQVLAKIHQIADARAEKLAARAAAPAPKPLTPPPAPIPAGAVGKYRCVAIGASTGGPPALQQILAALPSALPVGVVISQHMPEGFTKLFADRLDRSVNFRVKEAEGGEEIRSGLALLAPGGKHLLLHPAPNGKVFTAIAEAGPGDRYVPSIDRMLVSAAEIYRQQLMSVILTGMGDDGSVGIQTTRRYGGLTVAESEETCVVFGMPKEAIRSGAVDHVLPLTEIGGEIVRACRPG